MSDHLLALGAILEDEGPVGASLAVRASALIAEPGQRVEARQRLERAAELEQALMAGVALEPNGDEDGSGIGLATWLEDAMRAILRDAALGTSHAEICAAADDALITAGLEADDGGTEQRGSTAEWDALPEPTSLGEGEEADPVEVERIIEQTFEEPMPTEDEIRVRARDRADREGPEHPDGEDPGDEPERSDDPEEQMTSIDWLSEVSREATLEWPVSDHERRPQARERIDTPRVRHIFPVPDDADWPVRELEYDRAARRG